MAIQDKRYPSAKILDKIVNSCQLTNVIYARDKTGHYIADFSAPDWFKQLPEHTVAGPVLAAAPATRSPVQGKQKRDGACAQIRAWVLANPTATKAEALANFPHLNPSTVGVQYAQVKKNTIA